MLITLNIAEFFYSSGLYSFKDSFKDLKICLRQYITANNLDHTNLFISILINNPPNYVKELTLSLIIHLKGPLKCSASMQDDRFTGRDPTV